MKPFELILRPFPEEIRGIVRGVAEYDVKRGRFLIVIDEALDDAERLFALKHELSHILLGHHDQTDRDLAILEDEADRNADQMTDAEFSRLMTYQIREAVV